MVEPPRHPRVRTRPGARQRDVLASGGTTETPGGLCLEQQESQTERCSWTRSGCSRIAKCQCLSTGKSHRWATGLHVRQLAAGCSDGQSWPPKARRNCEQSLGLALLMCCRALGNRSIFPLRVGGLGGLRHRMGDSQIGGGGCSPPHPI